MTTENDKPILPSYIKNVIRHEGRHSNHVIEKLLNGSYFLLRKKPVPDLGGYSWHCVGDARQEYPSGEYVAQINKPHDPTDDSDAIVIYRGDSLDEAVEQLWQHRYSATN